MPRYAVTVTIRVDAATDDEAIVFVTAGLDGAPWDRDFGELVGHDVDDVENEDAIHGDDD